MTGFYLVKSFLIKCAQLCINSYEGKWGKVEKILDKEEKHAVDNVEFSFGKITGEPGTLYIVFRGSDEPEDWERNFQFGKLTVPYDNVNPRLKVHKGFLTDYKKVRDIILTKVKNFSTIILTGHSKGGAEATLAAVDIQYNFPDKVIRCVPVASPRVGNKIFADSYNKRVPFTIRVVNGEDFITKVPQNIFGYWHVDRLCQIGYKNPLCWIPIIRALGSLYHYPQLYLKNLIEEDDN